MLLVLNDTVQKRNSPSYPELMLVMRTNSNNHFSEVLAYAAMVVCILVVAYFILGLPGVQTPEIVP